MLTCSSKERCALEVQDKKKQGENDLNSEDSGSNCRGDQVAVFVEYARELLIFALR
jgi:hypothetical protein